MADSSPKRRALNGSCHCGATRFIIFLTLPVTAADPDMKLPTDSMKSLQRFYRCNCTSCHKAGFFHVRMPWAPDDFLLLSPKDPFEDLADYQCFEQTLHWFFCKTCGVRCFIFAGKGESAEVDLSESKITGKDGDMVGKVRAWRPSADEWGECRGLGNYLSVNGYTIDAGQEGFDLGVITEAKAVGYLDCLELNGEEREPRFDKPFENGAY